MKRDRRKEYLIRMNGLKVAQDMPRVTVVFDRRKMATDAVAGTVEVLVYVPRTRERKYISTGVKVYVNQWSEQYWVVGRGDAAQLNHEIREQFDYCLELLAVNPDVEQDLKLNKGGASFLDWLYGQIEGSKLAEGTKKHHWVMYRDLQAWGKIRTFKDVRSERLKAWIRNVEDTGVEQTTLYGYWKRLRKWLNVGIEERKLPMDCYLGVHVERGRSKEREFLMDWEIEAIRTAVLPSVHLAEVRDRAVMQMSTGLAYEDLMEFDLSRHYKMGGFETVQGRRVKTGEQFFLVVLPFGVDTLEKWEWKVPKISNVKYNEYLLELCKMVGIDKHVTSHVLRHTYACYALRHGVRLEAVSRALGHADIKTTQIYARLVDNDVVEAFGKMK